MSIETLYDNYLEFTDTQLGEFKPMEVAAIMLAQALSIYKTTLDPESYNKMVDTISESRDKVQTFEVRNLQ